VTPNLIVNLGLVFIFLCVLIAPLRSRKVEENLEVFLFLNGVVAFTLAGIATIPGEPTGWRWEIVLEALVSPVRIVDLWGIPVGIVQMVLLAGLAIYYGHAKLEQVVEWGVRRLSMPVMVFLLIVLLGLVSSIISAIIAAILLVELLCVLPLRRPETVKVIVIACFSIGLGAVLTPLGEPLSTIAVSKLAGEPYNAGFWYLFSTLGYLILPGVLACGLLGMVVVKRGRPKTDPACCPVIRETLWDVGIRAAKVYLFIMALVFLGEGFKPLIITYIVHAPAELLYWINMASAILDNATLASAEIGPALTPLQIKSALIGLLAAGGMLIPGNIPNIIAAGKLNISSKEWAKIGVPLGLVAMAVYFVVIFLPVYLGSTS
jgi:predicted cation transporter